MSIKICHFSDIHLSPLGHIPQSRTESYHQDVAAELDVLRNCLHEEKADVIVCSGDIFHLKNQSAYSPKDLNYYYEIFKTFPPFFAIPGNHDLPKSAFQNVKDSPYTSLTNFLPNIVQDLAWKTHIVKLNGIFKTFVLCGIPYISLDSFKAIVPKFVEEKQRELASDEHAPILWGFIVHVDATPEKILVNLWDSLSYKELASFFPNNSIIFVGHIHASFAPWQDEERNITIVKPWSIGRVIKDYFNKPDILEKLHHPSYSVVSLEESEEGVKIDIQYKPLPGIKFGADIFKTESLQTQLEKSKEIQELLLGLKNKIADAESIFFTQDAFSYIKNLNLEKDVFELITEYLSR